VQNTPIIFGLPRGSQNISGGNLYNSALIGALRATTTVLTLSVAECQARIERAEPGCYLLDSLNLVELVQLPAAHSGQRFVLLVHHLPSLEPEPDAAAIALERAALARCHTFVATSPFTAALLHSRGYDPTRILTLPPAPPPAAFEARSPAPPPFLLSMVGNLIPRKGYLELLDCLAAQLTVDDRFFLEVAGRADLDCDYASRCLARINAAPLRRVVRYLGPVPPAQLASCYRRATCFMSASKMETFGMAIQEARAYGLPVLAVDAGYVRHHFTDGQDGLLFGSAEALVTGCLSLVREPARMLALFASAQRSRPVSDYTWAKAAELLLSQL
jgi:glycosyltransferase involved in cell wall biosynthesis